MTRRHTKSALFPARGTAAPTDCVIALIDGAARGNPGPAAYGVVFKDGSGKVLARLNGRLGETTNNVAEYHALLAALSHARKRGWRRLKVQTDSELLARQLDGTYRVRSADLKPLHAEVQRLVAALDSFTLEAVPRRLTREADKLANAALDQRPATGTQRPAKKRFNPVAPAAGSVRVRAIYRAGVLKPLAPLGLADGEEVELLIRWKPSK